jgi:hypothetical protein
MTQTLTTDGEAELRKQERASDNARNHTVIAGDLVTYDEAFAIAAKTAGTERKESWRGRVRIKYRKSTGTFEVQVPT